MLFTEEDLGHVSSKLHLNIWFDSKIIITIWTFEKSAFLSKHVIKLRFWHKNYIADTVKLLIQAGSQIEAGSPMQAGWRYSYDAIRTRTTKCLLKRTSTPGGVFARHQRAHSSCLWRACQLSAKARFRWLRLVCGTVCRPMSLRRHHCRHSRDSWRQNCLLGATHSSGRVWHIAFYCSRCSHVLSFLSFFVL